MANLCMTDCKCLMCFIITGMFTYDKKAGVHWFSPAQCESYQEFNLVGVVSLSNKLCQSNL